MTSMKQVLRKKRVKRKKKLHPMVVPSAVAFVSWLIPSPLQKLVH